MLNLTANTFSSEQNLCKCVSELVVTEEACAPLSQFVEFALMEKQSELKPL